ncbi:MAG: serine--tRNA ligase [Candidatus Omnitrophica bacterium CG07_land_8_20_14_0_80_50_8]|nr:MAG: serine--tRNA ligase [Candidatus Omnitrophica bacterium CG07_land_8_20_14_0_80_50_8]
MLDLAFIRENKDKVREALKIRAPKLDFDGFLNLDVSRRAAMQALDALRAQKNQANDRISSLLKEKKSTKQEIEFMKSLSQKIADSESTMDEIDIKVKEILYIIPNLPHKSVESGVDSSNNEVVLNWGMPKKHEFKPKEHTELGQELGIIDALRASKISGSGFALYTGTGARLQRALINFMLERHTQHRGYTEIWPPSLVNRASMIGTGQLPKFEEDMYRLKEDELFLIPTAEVPVTNLHRDEILKEEDLPLKYTAYTPCFRREAGSYGKDTKGLVRIHQFDKVELVKFCKPENSYDEHEKLLKDAESILQLLEIPYRVLLLCSGDMGFSAAKCYDIEAWAPGLGRWLEVSSVSNFEAFQARRANIRYRRKDSGKTEFVHTLNGSGLALPRVMIAILENFQNADGSVLVPEVLRPYMGGMTVIRK